jgi:hypothetical protein
MNNPFRSFTKASRNKLADQVASSAFSGGARMTAMGCRATLGGGGFTSSGGGGFISADRGGSTSSGCAGGGGGTSSGSVGVGGGTSSLPRFLDGSLDDAMPLRENWIW